MVLCVTIDLFFWCLIFPFGTVCVEWIIDYFDICMYVYLYVCMYVSMWVDMYEGMYVCMYACLYGYR